MKKIFKHLKIIFIAMVLLCSCSGFNSLASAKFSDSQPTLESNGQVEKILRNYSGSFLCFPDEHIQTISIGPDDKDWKNKFDAYDCYYRPYVFEVDSQNPYYSSYDGVLYTKDHTKLLNDCPRKTDIKFHPKLQTIEMCIRDRDVGNGFSYIYDPKTETLTLRGEGVWPRNVTFYDTSIQTLIIEDGITTISNLGASNTVIVGKDCKILYDEQYTCLLYTSPILRSGVLRPFSAFF